MRSQATIETMIDGWTREVEAMKTGQPTNYQSILSRYASMTSGTYDYLVVSPGSNSRQYFRVEISTASGDTSAFNFQSYHRWDNANVMADPWFPATNTPAILVEILPEAPTTNSMAWQFCVIGEFDPVPHNVYFKFVVQATDDVTWSVSSL